MKSPDPLGDVEPVEVNCSNRFLGQVLIREPLNLDAEKTVSKFFTQWCSQREIEIICLEQKAVPQIGLGVRERGDFHDCAPL